MGPLDQLLKMIPGMDNMPGLVPGPDEGEAELDLVDAVICSMTPDERHQPDILNGSRRRRIARGSGTSVQEVNIVIKQYNELRAMMRDMTDGKPLQLGNVRLSGQKVKTRR